MRKGYLAFLYVILLLIFCGCTNHHSNCFVEGTYANDKCTLHVTSIDENIYKSKNGINVVEDDSINRKNQYYEIKLLILDENSGNYVELSFYNLVQTSVNAEPCFYEDEKGNSICPQEIQNHVQYVVVFNGEKYILN